MSSDNVEGTPIASFNLFCDSSVNDLYLEPGKQYDADAGFDLYCTDTVVPANAISFKIPLNVYCDPGPNVAFYDLRARSSTGSKTPLRLANSVGTIDGNYRGNIMAVVDNVSSDDFIITRGSRLFQIVLHGHLIEPRFVSSMDELTDTDRGTGGFGSTGV